MNRVDRFIASCPSWQDFWQRTRQLSKAEMGRAFERLVQLYLQTAPEYRIILRHVWLLREVPAQVRKRLLLPHPDEGIDLIALDRHGEYWAIQAKFRTQRDQPLTRTELGTFTSLAFNTCRNIGLAVVAHTCTRPVSKRHLMRDTVEIGLDRWRSADWTLIVGELKSESARPQVRDPKPHQAKAVSAARAHFVGDRAARGRLIMPCGTGKSLAAYWIAEALKAKTILVAVPSLALIRQGVTDWTREFLANGQAPDWLCVCSDETVGNLERDEFVGEVYELGLPTHTDPKKIATRLRTLCKGMRIVVTALSTQDERIADEFRAIRQGRIPSGKIVEISGDVPVGMHMSFGQFAEAISTRIWESVGRANWRSFEEARAFARKLGLKSHVEWWRWSSGQLKERNLGELPPDIPATPERVYVEHWKGWGDWLGHGRRIGGWRPFEEAREYARKLNLTSHKEWTALARDGRLPDDIPRYPDNVYDEWAAWWDWLGTSHRRGKWMTFTSARAVCRKAVLRSKAEFLKWRQGHLQHKVKCPPNIPMHLERVYPEFRGWPDFLGVTVQPIMTFDEAKAFVRQIGIKTQLEYRDWIVGRLRRPGLPIRPQNIPTNPDKVYSAFWKGWNEFFGTPKPKKHRAQMAPLRGSQRICSISKIGQRRGI